MVNETKIMVLVVILGSLLLGLLGAWFMSSFASRLSLIDLPNERSSHSLPTPRGGGIGILVAFIFSALILEIPYGFWIPASLLALISFFDDRLDLSPRIRLLFQFVAAIVVVFFAGLKGVNPFIVFSVATFFAIYIVGTANFYNFMDGINGIAGITGVVGFMLIALFAAKSGADYTVMLLSSCIGLSCLGFLPFNLPKAKVFMGDVGSVLLGFLFATIVVWLTSDLSSFICLASFLSPFYIDALMTIFVRWKDGEKLFKAHRRHLYQFLANELGYSHWFISLSYGGLQMSVGLLMIWSWTKGLPVQLILISLFILSFIFISLRIRNASCEIVD